MTSIVDYVYVSLYENGHKFRIIFGVGLIVAIFLNVFQPFGINNGGFSPKGILMVSGYGCATSMGLLLMVRFKNIFMQLYHIHVWLFTIISLFFISLLVFSYFKIIFSGSSSDDHYIEFLLNTSGVAILILWLIKGLLVNEYHPSEIPSSNLLIPSKNKSQSGLQLSIHNLIMIEAYGNYILVHYQHENTIKRMLIRNTMREVEELLRIYPTVIRCHSSFLINSNFLLTVKKNRRKYTLVIDHITHEIPVSKQHLSTVRKTIG